MWLHSPRRDWLEAAVESVISQSYPHWELCLCEDGTRQAWLDDYLSGLAAADERVRVIVSPEPRGQAASLNQAGRASGGEYMGLLEQDSLLTPHALYYVTQALNEEAADIVYSDEDRLDPEGRRVRPTLKPAWSPALLRSCMYIGRFLVIARRSLENAGWFREECPAACDHDLLLRLATGPLEVLHLPRILCHRRTYHSDSIVPVKVPESASRVSVIICSRNARLLNHCLRCLGRGTSFPSWEIVLALHTVTEEAKLVEVAKRYGCRFVTYPRAFNFAHMNNLAAATATGEHLLFLNDDVEPLSEGWMTCLASHLTRPEVGVVGAKLVYPGGTIQHAGMVLGMMSGVGHVGRGLVGSTCWKWLDSPRNVSAVTGACLGVRRDVFDRLQGFDIRFPVNYNDVDFCLRAQEAGFEVIYEPGALLRHREGGTRMPVIRPEERRRFFERWPKALDWPDPYYHPCLRRDTEEPKLDFAVR
jgi:GT2 family glycosyltransferase